MVLIINNGKDLNILNNENFKVLKAMCEVKQLKEEPYIILLLDAIVNDEGILENYNFFFEELLISLDVVAIITTKASLKLREICEFHKISLLEI